VSPQLAALFAQHKTVILGTAAAGVAGLALLQRRKGAAAPAGGPSVAGTIPAAAVVPAQPTGGGYDSSAYDVYSALQSELGPVLQQQAKATGTGGVTTAPKPIASTLFGANRTGTYVWQQGADAPAGVFEVESDGSLYHLSANDWGSINPDGHVAATKLGPDIGTPFYSLEGNLSAANGGQGATVFTTNAQGNYIPYVPKS
jgi:hypothetical protein